MIIIIIIIIEQIMEDINFLNNDVLSEILAYLDIEFIDNFIFTCKYFQNKEFIEIVYKSKINKSNDLQLLFEECLPNKVNCIKYLLKDIRFDPSINNNFAIRVASMNGNFDVVNLLLLSDLRIDPGADNHAIRLASLNGHIEVVKLLLSDSRVDPSAENNYAIRIASAKGHIDVVKLLLSDSRFYPSAQYNAAIRMASAKGHIEVVKLLLSDSRVDPSDRNNNAIKWASENGHVDVVKLLLSDQRVKSSIGDELLNM